MRIKTITRCMEQKQELRWSEFVLPIPAFHHCYTCSYTIIIHSEMILEVGIGEKGNKISDLRNL